MLAAGLVVARVAAVTGALAGPAAPVGSSPGPCRSLPVCSLLRAAAWLTVMETHNRDG